MLRGERSEEELLFVDLWLLELYHHKLGNDKIVENSLWHLTVYCILSLIFNPLTSPTNPPQSITNNNRHRLAHFIYASTLIERKINSISFNFFSLFFSHPQQPTGNIHCRTIIWNAGNACDRKVDESDQPRQNKRENALARLSACRIIKIKIAPFTVRAITRARARIEIDSKEHRVEEASIFRILRCDLSRSIFVQLVL